MSRRAFRELDAARAMLGQHSVGVADRYAELDENPASQVAQRIG